MVRVSAVGLAVALFSLAASHPALADPVRITGGSILVTGNSEVGSAELTGTRGFSLRGLVDPGESRVDPMNICGQAEGCAAGARVSLTAVFADFSFPNGVVTLDGRIYDDIDDANSPASPFFHLTGEAFLPAEVGEAFVLSGRFSFVEGLFNRRFPDRAVPIEARGGTALMWFQPGLVEDGRPTRWVLDQVRYDFSDVAPVPEPGTLLLLATGALAVARRVRQRRSEA